MEKALKLSESCAIKTVRDAYSEKNRKERTFIQETILSGRYRLLSELGRGNGSVVYLARHQRLGEYRAVKCIPKDSDFTWQIREAEILNHLKHPQIPIIYDVEEDEESYYIVEEFVEGQSLEALMLQSSFITLNFIYHTITEVADILKYLHHLSPEPMVYQDLKAEHVIVHSGGVKLIDFGIAACSGKEGNKFQNYGTPKFAAPEKKTGAKISPATDIYSLGKLLEELILADRTGEARCLMHIAKKAMHPKAKLRYQSAEAFEDDLNRAMQSGKDSIYHEHLLKKIVVAGCQSRVGATHVAISLTAYMNQQGIPAVYQEKDSKRDMRVTVQNGGFTEESGLYRRGTFTGMPEYGGGVSVDVPEGAVRIMDYGADAAGALAEKPGLFLLVAGSREWETVYADQTYEQVKHSENLALLSNYGNVHQAKQYARRYGRTVYCFPLDENPFFMTREKERLFEKLLKTSGGENKGGKEKSHRYSGKRPGRRGYAFVRCIGQLYGKRPWRKYRLR